MFHDAGLRSVKGPFVVTAFAGAELANNKHALSRAELLLALTQQLDQIFSTEKPSAGGALVDAIISSFDDAPYIRGSCRQVVW